MGVFIWINAKSLKPRDNGTATADIRLSIDGQDFPEKAWNDFAVVITSWLASALLRLMRGESSFEVVDFMDGPYAFELSYSENKMLLVKGMAGSGRDRELARGEVSLARFLDGLIGQANGLLEECVERNWWSSDAELLKSTLHDLRREMMRSQCMQQ